MYNCVLFFSSTSTNVDTAATQLGIEMTKQRTLRFVIRFDVPSVSTTLDLRQVHLCDQFPFLFVSLSRSTRIDYHICSILIISFQGVRSCLWVFLLFQKNELLHWSQNFVLKLMNSQILIMKVYKWKKEIEKQIKLYVEMFI